MGDWGEFNREWDALGKNKESVLSKVEEATKRKGEVRYNVLKWLEDANELLEIAHTCSWAPEGPQFLEETTQDMKSMNISVPKDVVQIDVVPEDKLLMAPENGELRFNATTLKELSKKLLDDSINKIGLYGERGSGKTTLVEAVRDKVKSLNIFDEVLFATMSQNPDDWNIQDQIAESLNTKFLREGLVGRAMEISSTLANKRRILVILDDVPSKFDPEKYMGIPCSDKRCKFLLTTCNKQECILMLGRREIPCQEMIPMGPLTADAAWRLLQKHSGTEDNKSNLSKVANEIASKYEWLPRTIIDIGCSLKDKPYKEWEGFLNSLRHSTARYHIFLSFRGIDTRHNFTSTLCAELRKKGFKTFMDDTGLGDGDSIATELVKAIKGSRLSIVVLSENYSNSSWCLDELVHILECKKTKNQLVWPIFYKVEPTHVRHQTGGFGKAMAEVEEKFKNDPEKIQKWKSALVDVAQLSGRTYDEGSETEFIQKYVAAVKKAKNYLYIPNMDMI